ncbi:AMP-binding protein [Rhizobium sp. CSW-27]|uniref:AMP-binding protein n=1 Tax=Rhizobium sp. CSW-27 TaxID=2839985 RepID=UPI001C030C7F|nr:AMP-binding protein [Rhizobium sp. CSW-27]MBT9373340.1 AMP-binding protein [Rhizobium sp. CSW-27]
MKHMSLERQVRDACEARADKEIVVFSSRGATQRVMTGRELLAAAESAARQLEPARGCCVVLVFPAGEPFISLLLGCFLAGVTAIPVAPPRRGSISTRLAHICAEARPAAVLCQQGLEEGLRTLLGAGAPPVLAWATGLEPPITKGFRPDMPQDTVLIQYTSGSTMTPKGVLISADNILANCNAVQRAWGLDAAARIVNWMPHYHDMGLIGGILCPFFAGGMSVQMSPFDFIRSPRLWLDVISQWKANFSGGPTFAFADVIRKVPQEALAGLDLSSWSRAYCGAEPIPPGLLEVFASHLAAAGLRRDAVFACYGMAEITLFAAGTRGGPHDAGTDGAQGCWLTDEMRQQIVIIDTETGEPVKDGQPGEIWLGGPSQGSGYLASPDLTAESFGHTVPGQEGKFLRTGDIGRIRDGRLWISGRLKDVLFAHGLTIPAAEVETLACKGVPELNAMAAAAFMRDENLPGEAVLLVELVDSRVPVPSPEETRNRMRSTVLGEWGLELCEIHFVDRGQLPRTTSGKVRRSHAAALFRTGNEAFSTGEQG